MNKRTKLILSIIGVAAVVVPAVLLIVSSTLTSKTQAPAATSRTIDQSTIDDAVKKTPQKAPEFPSPTATVSASVKPSSSPGPTASASALPR